jgi:NADP-dependent 3-hydroxy acid dehydrogenase YdfG
LQITTWTQPELARIEATDELQIAALRRDGTLRKPVTIWGVRAGDDLYVRSAYGHTAAWYRGTQLRLEGRVDVMINNAGLMPQSCIQRLKVDEWDQMIDVNIKGVLYGIVATLPHMMQRKPGYFANVSSAAGYKVGIGAAVYAATKHAVRALFEGLRQEVKPYSIRTTVISPGAVATELPNTITDPDAAVQVQEFYADAAIPADSFARTVAFAISQPDDVDINEILFRPTRREY